MLRRKLNSGGYILRVDPEEMALLFDAVTSDYYGCAPGNRKDELNKLLEQFGHETSVEEWIDMEMRKLFS